MPTIRSHYTFKQFEEALQKLAHGIAIDAVMNLDQGRITIKTFDSNQFSEVSLPRLTIRFYLRHASYTVHGKNEWTQYWSFDVEEKLYITSNHATKISYYAGDDSEQAAKRKKKIIEFIDELMEGVEIVPRFSLSQVSGN